MKDTEKRTIKPSDINLTCAELLGWKWQTCGIRGDHLHWHEPAPGAELCHDPDRAKKDFFEHDPRGTVMLIKELIRIKGEHLAFRSIADEMALIFDKVLETAIARAFLRANGIEVSE